MVKYSYTSTTTAKDINLVEVDCIGDIEEGEAVADFSDGINGGNGLYNWSILGDDWSSYVGDLSGASDGDGDSSCSGGHLDVKLMHLSAVVDSGDIYTIAASLLTLSS